MAERPPHELISPTAWSVAERRSFTDIPLAREILDAIAAMAGDASFPKVPAGAQNTPVFEARYKLTNRLLAESGIRQVIELAAGFSPRGMTLTADPAIRYVELDLPDIAAKKRAMLETFIAHSVIGPRPNLQIAAANVVAEGALLLAIRDFAPAPVAVINEGLLRYLTFPEKESVARNVRSVLERFGGLWITPDIRGISGLQNERAAVAQLLTKLTGQPLEATLFRDEAHALAFFESLGFTVERHPLTEAADELVSPRRLALSAEAVAKALGERIAFVMRLRR
jgi:O-methyltransferase involved in polyketide biosynthesis